MGHYDSSYEFKPKAATPEDLAHYDSIWKRYNGIMKERKGDITSIQSGLIIHQVNCQHTMGSGVALAIRNKWPAVFEEYKNIHSPQLGQVQFVQVTPRILIANLFGQEYYGRSGERYTSYDALDEGFKTIAARTDENLPIHLPLIGCGLGGGKWPIVRAIIMEHLKGRDLTLWQF